jgi:hypothetical protein
MALIMASATPGEPLWDATIRPPQITTVFEEEPSMFLRMLIVPWVARQV